MGTQHELLSYFKMDRWPNMFCPGCGIGVIMQAFAKAIDDLGMDHSRIAMVSGIGCSGRIPGYMDFDSLHGTHGRALAIATGAALARPDLRFVVWLGDGDGLSIGGNHFLHAAQRNLSMTVVLINNFNYALTGGQVSPTTPKNMRTKTTPRGNVARPLDPSRIAEAAGASYVARWTTLQSKEMSDSFREALSRDGFCLVEILSQCPPIFGRRNRMEDPIKLTRWISERTVSLDTYDPGLHKDKVTVGELVH